MSDKICLWCRSYIGSSSEERDHSHCRARFQQTKVVIERIKLPPETMNVNWQDNNNNINKSITATDAVKRKPPSLIISYETVDLDEGDLHDDSTPEYPLKEGHKFFNFNQNINKPLKDPVLTKPTDQDRNVFSDFPSLLNSESHILETSPNIKANRNNNPKEVTQQTNYKLPNASKLKIPKNVPLRISSSCDPKRHPEVSSLRHRGGSTESVYSSDSNRTDGINWNNDSNLTRESIQQVISNTKKANVTLCTRNCLEDSKLIDNEQAIQSCDDSQFTNIQLPPQRVVNCELPSSHLPQATTINSELPNSPQQSQNTVHSELLNSQLQSQNSFTVNFDLQDLQKTTQCPANSQLPVLQHPSPSFKSNLVEDNCYANQSSSLHPALIHSECKTTSRKDSVSLVTEKHTPDCTRVSNSGTSCCCLQKSTSSEINTTSILQECSQISKQNLQTSSEQEKILVSESQNQSSRDNCVKSPKKQINLRQSPEVMSNVTKNISNMTKKVSNITKIVSLTDAQHSVAGSIHQGYNITAINSISEVQHLQKDFTKSMTVTTKENRHDLVETVIVNVGSSNANERSRQNRSLQNKKQFEANKLMSNIIDTLDVSSKQSDFTSSQILRNNFENVNDKTASVILLEDPADQVPRQQSRGAENRNQIAIPDTLVNYHVGDHLQEPRKKRTQAQEPRSHLSTFGSAAKELQPVGSTFPCRQEKEQVCLPVLKNAVTATCQRTQTEIFDSFLGSYKQIFDHPSQGTSPYGPTDGHAQYNVSQQQHSATLETPVSSKSGLPKQIQTTFVDTNKTPSNNERAAGNNLVKVTRKDNMLSPELVGYYNGLVPTSHSNLSPSQPLPARAADTLERTLSVNSSTILESSVLKTAPPNLILSPAERNLHLYERHSENIQPMRSEINTLIRQTPSTSYSCHNDYNYYQEINNRANKVHPNLQPQLHKQVAYKNTNSNQSDFACFRENFPSKCQKLVQEKQIFVTSHSVTSQGIRVNPAHMTSQPVISRGVLVNPMYVTSQSLTSQGTGEKIVENNNIQTMISPHRQIVNSASISVPNNAVHWPAAFISSDKLGTLDNAQVRPLVHKRAAEQPNVEPNKTKYPSWVQVPREQTNSNNAASMRSKQPNSKQFVNSSQLSEKRGEKLQSIVAESLAPSGNSSHGSEPVSNPALLEKIRDKVKERTKGQNISCKPLDLSQRSLKGQEGPLERAHCSSSFELLSCTSERSYKSQASAAKSLDFSASFIQPQSTEVQATPKSCSRDIPVTCPSVSTPLTTVTTNSLPTSVTSVIPPATRNDCPISDPATAISKSNSIAPRHVNATHSTSSAPQFTSSCEINEQRTVVPSIANDTSIQQQLLCIRPTSLSPFQERLSTINTRTFVAVVSSLASVVTPDVAQSVTAESSVIIPSTSNFTNSNDATLTQCVTPALTPLTVSTRSSLPNKEQTNLGLFHYPQQHISNNLPLTDSHSAKLDPLPVKDFFTHTPTENTYSSLLMAKITSKNKGLLNFPKDPEFFPMTQPNNDGWAFVGNNLQRNLVIDLTDDCDVISVSSSESREDDLRNDFLDEAVPNNTSTPISLAACLGNTENIMPEKSKNFILSSLASDISSPCISAETYLVQADERDLDCASLSAGSDFTDHSCIASTNTSDVISPVIDERRVSYSQILQDNLGFEDAGIRFDITTEQTANAIDIPRITTSQNISKSVFIYTCPGVDERNNVALSSDNLIVQNEASSSQCNRSSPAFNVTGKSNGISIAQFGKLPPGHVNVLAETRYQKKANHQERSNFISQALHSKKLNQPANKVPSTPTHDNSTQRAAATLLELSANPLYNSYTIAPEASDSYLERVYQIHPIIKNNGSAKEGPADANAGYCTQKDQSSHNTTSHRSRTRTGRRVGRPLKDQFIASDVADSANNTPVTKSSLKCSLSSPNLDFSHVNTSNPHLLVTEMLHQTSACSTIPGLQDPIYSSKLPSYFLHAPSKNSTAEGAISTNIPTTATRFIPDRIKINTTTSQQSRSQQDQTVKESESAFLYNNSTTRVANTLDVHNTKSSQRKHVTKKITGEKGEYANTVPHSKMNLNNQVGSSNSNSNTTKLTSSYTKSLSSKAINILNEDFEYQNQGGEIPNQVCNVNRVNDKLPNISTSNLNNDCSGFVRPYVHVSSADTILISGNEETPLHYSTVPNVHISDTISIGTLNYNHSIRIVNDLSSDKTATTSNARTATTSNAKVKTARKTTRKRKHCQENIIVNSKVQLLEKTANSLLLEDESLLSSLESPLNQSSLQINENNIETNTHARRISDTEINDHSQNETINETLRSGGINDNGLTHSEIDEVYQILNTATEKIVVTTSFESDLPILSLQAQANEYLDQQSPRNGDQIVPVNCAQALLDSWEDSADISNQNNIASNGNKAIAGSQGLINKTPQITAVSEGFQPGLIKQISIQVANEALIDAEVEKERVVASYLAEMMHSKFKDSLR